jgi:sensor histidine kinase regulating citrate/malate metabolism
MGLPPDLMAFAQDDGMTPGASLPPVGSGLTLSHRLARGMNGTLLLANQPDSGASVSLSLPAAGQLSVEVNGATKAA